MAVQDQLAALEQAFTPQFSQVATAASDFEPTRLFRMVLQYRWVIIACLLAGLISGLLYTKVQRPVFHSTAKVEVITSSAKVLQELEVSSQVNGLVAFETARQKILSRDVAERVVERLNLAYDPTFLAQIPKFSLSNLFGDPLATASQTDISATDVKTRHENAIAKVRQNLSAKLIRNTSILAVTYQHPSPAYSRAVVNAIASAYIGLTVEQKTEVSNRARQVLGQQAILAKSKLETSEQALVDYAKNQGLTVVGENSDLIAGNINEINKLLAHAVNERLLAERYSAQLKQNGAASLPQSFESNTVQAAKDKLIDLKAEYQQKLATLKPGFPTMRKLRSQIINVERSLSNEIRAIGAGIRIQLKQARSKETSLRSELRKLEEQKREYQRKNIRYTILRREADSNRAHYQSLIKKLSEVGVGASLKTATASMVDAADFPREPASPRLLINLLGGLMLFSMLGAFLVYAKELYNDGFSDPEQLSDELDLPVLGTIPHTAGLSDGDDDDAQANGVVEDAYCILRTAVQHMRTINRTQTLLVTSTDNGEGKSTTARHLAENFARLGEQVLLVDADLRKPGLHKTYNVNNTFGFADLLNGSLDIEDQAGCFKATPVPNLTVLPSGKVTSNPSYLLASQKMRDLFAALSETYDVIILDSAPVSGYADALLMSRETDATLFVVAGGQAKRSAVHSALSRLQMTGGKVMGTAFTMFKTGWLDGGLEQKYADKLNTKWQNFSQSLPTAKSSDHRNKKAQNALSEPMENPVKRQKVA